MQSSADFSNQLITLERPLSNIASPNSLFLRNIQNLVFIASELAFLPLVQANYTGIFANYDEGVSGMKMLVAFTLPSANRQRPLPCLL